jgi:protein-tyrosine phosphatase
MPKAMHLCPRILIQVLVGGILFAGAANAEIERFAEVSPGIFRGSKPTTQADFDFLKAHEVRTILSLQTLPWDIITERRHARENKIEYRNVYILAFPLAPSESRVKDALLTLADPSLHPIFIHCRLGRDRTGMIVGLYRIYYQNWTPKAAWDEMLRLGFKLSWTLRGLETYFWHHTQKPDWASRSVPKIELEFPKADLIR